MPYHDELLTLWAAFWLWLTLFACGVSLFQLFHVMRSSERCRLGLLRRRFGSAGLFISVVLLVVLASVSWDTTEAGRFIPLAKAKLAGAELSLKPAGWQDYDIWLEDWELQFRHKEGLEPLGSDDSWTDDKFNQYRQETARRWEALTKSLDSPDLREADLRGAFLAGAFLTGADLRGARLEGADLRGTWLEGTELIDARLENANLRNARMAGADLRGAQLKGSYIRHSGTPNIGWLEHLDLLDSFVQGADLDWARPEPRWRRKIGIDRGGVLLRGADLRGAWLEDIDLRRVRLEGADLRGARLDRADLRGASLKGADLRGALLARADLRGVWLQGNDPDTGALQGTDLRWARLEGSDLMAARLEGTDLSQTFGLTQRQLDFACGDQHTRLPDGFTVPTCVE